MKAARAGVLLAVLLAFTSTLGIVSYNPFSAAEEQLTSWNPNVPCTPILVTLEDILGSQTNELGGAASEGSRFYPGIPNQRDLTPPCTITNQYGEAVSAFVEVHGVKISNPPVTEGEDCSTSFHPVNGGGPYPDGNGDGSPDVYCDTTDNLESANAPDCPACYMHRIRWEIDGDWKAAGYAGPGTAADDNTINQVSSELLDVQGFLFWDTTHTDEEFHSFSGWEFDPLSAWRLSNSEGNETKPATLSFEARMLNTEGELAVDINGQTVFVNAVNETADIYKQFTVDITVVQGPNSLGFHNPRRPIGGPGAFNEVQKIRVTLGDEVVLDVPARIVPEVEGGCCDFSFSVKDTTLPSWSQNSSLTASTIKSTTVTLTWTGASDNVGVANYRVFRDSTPLTDLPGTIETCDVTGLEPGTTYTFKVEAGDASNNWSTTGPSVTVRTPPDFGMGASPDLLTITQGLAGTSTITLTSLGGFEGTVELAATVSPAGSNGPTTLLVFPTVSLEPGGTATSTLIVQTTLLTQPGDYIITVTGTSNELSHTTMITLRVNSVGL